MKVSPLTLLLLGAAAGGLLFGSCQASRASEAEITLHLALAQHAHTDSLASLKQDSLRGVAVTLRDSASLLALRLRGATTIAAHARRAVDSLLALTPDSLRDALDSAVTRIGVVGLACAESLQNCEQRAANAEQRASLDSGRVVALQGLNHDLEDAWHSAEQRARPSLLRDFWRSRRLTGPLVLLSVVLILER